MCGIVGYVGHQDAVSFILPGLRRLEYRGYDSAGIATVSGQSLDIRKTTGKIADLEALIASDYASVQGFVLMMALLYVLLNLCIDIVYGLVDPRVRLEA